VDAVVVRATDGTAIDVPDGVRGYGGLTFQSSGMMRADQMWFAMRVRPHFGTTQHGGGSVRFFRWSDSDAARIEAFYAISTDAWGVRRANPSDTFFSVDIPATSVPCVAGQPYTVIGQFAPTWIGISINGSAWDAYPLSRKDNSTYPTITAETFEIAPTGQAEGSPSGGMDVLWFALGRGCLLYTSPSPRD